MQVAERNDLLVIGQRAKNPLLDLIRAHLANRVAEKSRRPVLVVRRPAQSPYRQVLLPVDFTPSSDAAAIVAFAISRGSRLDVFHACETSIESRLRRAQVSAETIRQSIKAERRMLVDRVRRKLDDLDYDGAEAMISVGRGPAVASILEQVHERGADLIVTGRQHRSWLLGALIGSVSMRLMKESGCDVLIVPHPALGGRARVEPAPLSASTGHLTNARMARHAAALAGVSTEVELTVDSIRSEYQRFLQQAAVDSSLHRKRQGCSP